MAIQKPITIDPKKEGGKKKSYMQLAKDRPDSLHVYIYAPPSTYMHVQKSYKSQNIPYPKETRASHMLHKRNLTRPFDPRKSPSQKTFGEPINDFFSNLSFLSLSLFLFLSLSFFLQGVWCIHTDRRADVLRQTVKQKTSYIAQEQAQQNTQYYLIRIYIRRRR